MKLSSFALEIKNLYSFIGGHLDFFRHFGQPVCNFRIDQR